MDATFAWINEPPRWAGDATRLELETAERTDFWRETFYGFTRDSGHAWVAPVGGDFSVSARFTGRYETLYDQAGLIVFGPGDAWMKTGVEFTDGLMHFSVVMSAGRSDWSVIPLHGATADSAVSARVTRLGEAMQVRYAVGDGPWRMARLAPFPSGPVRAGVMACSPERGGFGAAFTDIALGPAGAEPLHAD